MTRSPFRFSIILLAIAIAFGFSYCTKSIADDATFFENKIRPILVQHCYECHSTKADDIGGNLLLDSRDAMLKGGVSGPALVAGNPEASLIIQALRHSDDLEMPPEDPLPQAVVNNFVKWVKLGAIDPRTPNQGEKPVLPQDRPLDAELHWSFFPRSNPALPKVKDKAWPHDPIDQFVLARLESEGLRPTSDASPRTLIRRLYYDLVGLSPSAAEIESFVERYKQHDQRAVESLVDYLLAQPQFGERWGRHWLDVARYGESNGDDGLGRNATFPHAWRYRDYVIDAMNRDVPYDRFLTEQIAGDLLPAANAQQRNRQLIATGFLAIGSKPAVAMNKNFAMDIVADQINVVSTAAMGLSAACARCHDHKHDPIPTRDYYAMAGIFTSSETLYGAAGKERLTAPPTPLHELTSWWDPNAPKPNKVGETPKFAKLYAQAIERIKPSFNAALDKKPNGLTIKPEADKSGTNFSAENFASVNDTSLQGQLAEAGNRYSVSFWFKNEIKNNARPITAYLFSRGAISGKPGPGDHLGIGGKHRAEFTGKLILFNGPEKKETLIGKSTVAAGTWNHVVLVRDERRVKVFLNGNKSPEIDGESSVTFEDTKTFCLGSRSDNFAPLKGSLAHFAIFPRALSDAESQQLFDAAGVEPPQAVKQGQKLGVAMGVREKAKCGDCKIHINGDLGKLGAVVRRGFLTAYQRVSSEEQAGAKPPISDEFNIDPQQSGRRQLAAWVTHPDHPQTARVMANRIWLHLFGQGIVTTPDDFGVYGARPTHPELLDHLAERFVSNGWSIKRMIRAIVLSRTYQLDSRASAEAVKADSDNVLYSRHLRRRLDAESLRDSLLQASGELDLSPGIGSAVETIDQLINWPPGEATDLHRPSRHRSVYLCMLRHSPPIELAPFDLPDGIDVVSQRNVTTLPTQALFLLNSPLVVEQAATLAEKTLAMEGRSDEQRVSFVFRQVLKRDPTDQEKEQSLRHLREIEDKLVEMLSVGQVPDSGARRQKAWANFCQALLTTNEFRFVD